jgi:hypothetical protein
MIAMEHISLTVARKLEHPTCYKVEGGELVKILCPLAAHFDYLTIALEPVSLICCKKA